MKRVRVKGFYGGGAFDTNDLFTLMHSIGARPVVKIRKNASTVRHGEAGTGVGPEWNTGKRDRDHGLPKIIMA